jgi:hypothetical protein
MRRLVGPALAGALLGAALTFLIGGVIVFRGLLFGGAGPEDGPSLLALNGPRVAAMAARLFALPGALGGAAAALVAFRRRRGWGRRPGPTAAALAGLVVAALASPAGLHLHVASLLGPGERLDARVSARALATTALLCGAAGLLAGVVLDRAAARRERAGRLG